MERILRVLIIYEQSEKNSKTPKAKTLKLIFEPLQINNKNLTNNMSKINFYYKNSEFLKNVTIKTNCPVKKITLFFDYTKCFETNGI